MDSNMDFGFDFMSCEVCGEDTLDICPNCDNCEDCCECQIFGDDNLEE